MFEPNNPDIDLAALAQRVQHRAATRRRPDIAPLAPPPAPTEAAEPVAPAGWRAQVRGWPVIGPFLAYTRRGVRAASQPGLSLRARVRALPFVGAASAWLSAVATLPRWRRHLHQQDARLLQDVAHLNQEVAALRSVQTELMRELTRARIAIRALQAERADARRAHGDTVSR